MLIDANTPPQEMEDNCAYILLFCYSFAMSGALASTRYTWLRIDGVL